MKTINSKLLYLISAACIIVSIYFKVSQPILYYSFLALGGIVFLIAVLKYYKD